MIYLRKSLMTSLFGCTCLVLALWLAEVVANDNLDPKALCQQQIIDYQIAPEQAQDYLRNCIQSMGGEIDSETDSGNNLAAGTDAGTMTDPAQDPSQNGMVNLGASDNGERTVAE